MRALDLLFAARPMLHLPIWSVYIITHHYKTGGDQLDWRGFGMLAILSLIAAGAYFFNLVHDEETDRLNAKLGFLERGYLARGNLMLAYLVVSVIGLVGAAWFGVWSLMIVSLLFVVGWAYSASSLRLKDRPVSGLMANAIAYGVLVPMLAAGSLHHVDWPMCAYFTVCIAATHLLTTLPDRDGDQQAGKRTVAVVLPSLAIKLLAFLLLLGSVAVAWWTGAGELVYLSVMAVVLTAAAAAVGSRSIHLAAIKLPILGLTLIAGFYYAWYLAFVVALLVSTRLYYVRRFGEVYPRLT